MTPFSELSGTCTHVKHIHLNIFSHSEIGAHYVPLVGLQLPMYINLALNSQVFTCLPSAWIQGISPKSSQTECRKVKLDPFSLHKTQIPMNQRVKHKPHALILIDRKQEKCLNP